MYTLYRIAMISALFRIREPQTGKIELDGKSGLTLFETRKNLSIIPQEPIIFSDTVRGNLDPFSEYEENLVWKFHKALCFGECGPETKIQRKWQGPRF